jgi:N-acetylglucosaminyl-diphospho-decaprenol L-rhamnosyltransferase
MKPARIRAVVLNFNRAAMTLVCVEHLHRQSHAPLDVLVVDSGSGSEDFAILRQSLPPSARLLRSERNLGYAAGNNFGARDPGLPDYDQLLVVNNDVTLPDRRTVSELSAALAADPRAVAASPLVNNTRLAVPVECQIQVRRVPGIVTDLVAGSWWLRRLPLLRGLAERHLYGDLRPFPRGQALQCETINGACFLISAAFLGEIGFFDEATFLFHEELILGHQMRARGKHAKLVTSAVVGHHQGATTGQRIGRQEWHAWHHLIRSEAHYWRHYLRVPRPLLGLLVAVRLIDYWTKRLFLVRSFLRRR